MLTAYRQVNGRPSAVSSWANLQHFNSHHLSYRYSSCDALFLIFCPLLLLFALLSLLNLLHVKTTKTSKDPRDYVIKQAKTK